MIKVSDLSFSYSSNKHILRQIAFDAEKGECIAILGNNGAGKSTLIKCLNRILQPQGGAVYIDGNDLNRMKRQEIARHVSYTAQNSTGNSFTVFDAVLMGRRPYIKLNATDKDLEIVKSVIDKMGLNDFALRYTDELSGGEMQKVMLARTLAQQPRVLLLDEPTNNLDLKNQYEVMSIVREIAKAEGISVIIVMHDLNLALRYCDMFMFIKDLGVFAYGGAEIMNEENIKAVYGMDVAVTKFFGVNMVVPLPDL